MTDPIADMLARIRNATTARHPRVDMPLSRLKVEIAKILESEGYIQGFKVVEPKDGEPQGTLRVQLRIRAARRARHHRHPARQPPGPPRLLRPRQRPRRPRRPRLQHPDDVARRHDRARKPSRPASAAKCSVTSGSQRFTTDDVSNRQKAHPDPRRA